MAMWNFSLSGIQLSRGSAGCEQSAGDQNGRGHYRQRPGCTLVEKELSAYEGTDQHGSYCRCTACDSGIVATGK